MAFKQVTSAEASNAVIGTLARKLRAHAEDFQVLDLRVQSGKNGYQSVHRWEDDGTEANLTGDDGTVILIAGSSPEDIARMVVEYAIQHVEESNEKGRNYKVFGLLLGEGEEKETFSHLIPQATFGVTGNGGGGGLVSNPDNHEVYTQIFSQLQRQNDKLFSTLMMIVGSWPTLMTKITELIEQLGDLNAGQSGNSTEALLQVLQFEAERERRWMEHDKAKQSHHDRAEILKEVIEVAGPDVLELMKKVFEEIKAGMGKRNTTTPNTSAPDDAPAPAPAPSGLAARLNELFRGLSADALKKVQALLSVDEWKLIDGARKAGDDDEFKALFQRLDQLWRERGQEDVKALQEELIKAIGMPAAYELNKLIKNARS